MQAHHFNYWNIKWSLAKPCNEMADFLNKLFNDDPLVSKIKVEICGGGVREVKFNTYLNYQLRYCDSPLEEVDPEQSELSIC